MGSLFSLSDSRFFAGSKLLGAVEPRLKLFLLFSGLLLLLFKHSPWPGIAFTGICVGTLLVLGLPLRFLLIRYLIPFMAVGLMSLLQALSLGPTPAITISFGPWELTAYQEGIYQGLLLFTRVMGGVSLVTVLALTTPLPQLLAAAAWFRVPTLFLETTILAYRYLFLFQKEASRVWQAQSLRLGHRGWRQRIRSIGTLMGILVFRAWDRAEAVQLAVEARGGNTEGAMVVDAPIQIDLQATRLFAGGTLFLYLMLLFL